MGNNQNNTKDKSGKDKVKDNDKKEHDKKNNHFYMHIQFVGEDLTNFYKNLIASENLICIKDYWIFEKIDENLSITEQINNYFSFLENQKVNRKRNEKETLIIKVKNISSQEINLFLEKMNNLEQTYYMPLVLILYEKEEENKNIETEKYENIDSRLIKIEEYSEDLIFIEEKISTILLRFCSIHNELGDKFSIEEKESFDLTNKNFAFNLNIACIGRIGQGKSAGVNVLLKEYKAKEVSKGGSETKSVQFYQVEDQPIRILDVPGYEDDDAIRQSLEKFKEAREKINRLKDKIHIILYFLNGHEERTFYKLEYLILDEILEHKSSKIIYVITHSNSKITDKEKKNKIEKINSGIEKCLEEKEKINKKSSEIVENNKNKYELIYASLDNIVFVNFHKDESNGDKFGDKDLFNKIKDLFIKSDDYKHFSGVNIEEEAQKLKAEAKAALLSNKIWGSVAGLIPIADKAIHHFIIKKKALKKVGGIFGIDIKFVNKGYDKNYFNIPYQNPGGLGLIGSLTSEAASIGAKVAGIGVGVAACFIGVGINGYYTYKFCNEILDQFEIFYKNNGEQMKNSYEDAVKYFSG